MHKLFKLLSMHKLFKLVFGVIILCTTSPFQHTRTACCLSSQDENLFQDASDLEEEMCQLHTTVAMIVASQSY